MPYFWASPTLNWTGELKHAFWSRIRATSSSWKVSRSSGDANVPASSAQPVIVSTTRATSWATETSRSGVPTSP
jgi:hypothetical protein